MLNTATKSEAPGTEQELTDGFHLVIDALKLNGINTIYNVPGIPITDLGRMAQAAGIRMISFRHEQNAGYAAGIAGYLTKKPGICLTVSAPGFLNGLTALAHATTNCYPMILISGSSEREIVDLQQGDYEEMDQLAIAKPLCKAAFRVLHAEDIGIGIARAIRSAVAASRFAPGAASEPQIWRGTPVAGSHVASQWPPVAASAIHATGGVASATSGFTVRSGFATFAAGNAVKVSAVSLAPSRGFAARAGETTATLAMQQAAHRKPRTRRTILELDPISRGIARGSLNQS
jgi:hypothetical protein